MIIRKHELKTLLDKKGKLKVENQNKLKGKGIYKIIFDDGCEYIGKTVNFKDRMYSHMGQIYMDKNSKSYIDNRLYRKLRTMKHVVNVYLYEYPEDTTDEELYSYEIEYIRLAIEKKGKRKVLNETKGGLGVNSGEFSYNYRDKYYYKTHATYYYLFNEMCAKKGWNIKDFDVVHCLDENIKDFKKKYYFIYNGKGDAGIKPKRNPNKNPQAKPIEYYETNPVLVYDFKKICKRRGYIFEHFQYTFYDYKYYKNKNIKPRPRFLFKYVGEIDNYTPPSLKENISKSKMKEVSQYSLDGKWIKDYKSIDDAVISLFGVKKATRISDCCKGKILSSCGFKWRFKKEKVIEVIGDGE